MKFKKINFLIFTILIIGLIYRFYLSWDGNFIFNMDNARDMVDVREMVSLGKPRLIGQTTAIDGLYYGPLWYYMLSIPFIISEGNPYASILMEIILWIIGGYFLLFLVNKFYGILATLVVGCIWIASNFILLGTQYAFNPNPILFLTPVFIFCLWKFIEKEKWIFNILSWFLAGAFLQFEVAVGLFMPLVIILSLIFSKKWVLLKNKKFYLGPGIFILTLIPQLIFELRHDFFMTKALIAYKSGSHGGVGLNPPERTVAVFKSFYDTFLPTLMNFREFTKGMIVLFIGVVVWIFKTREKISTLTLICFLIIFVTLFGLIPLKVDLMRWHLNAVLIASIFMVGFVFWFLQRNFLGKIVAIILLVILFINTFQNMQSYIQASQKGDGGNSILKNELAAIDFTYREAESKNFKVYVYLPSVIDYPYQYLYWWHGKSRYGYLPEEYAYLPGVPEYVKNKKAFSAKPEDLNKRENSKLIFLIKEPDQIGQRHLWENSFKNLELLDSQNIGSIIVEKRKTL